MKLGYGICQSTEYPNGFYKATLTQGKDEAYIAKLKGITGQEKENTLDLLGYLGNTVNQTPQPRTKDTVKPHYLSQEVLDRVAKESTERLIEVGKDLDVKEPTKKPRKTRTKKGDIK